MKKRVLSMALTLVMLLTALPLSAFAAGNTYEEVLTFLKVSIDEPVEGREADFYPGVGALPTNAARVYVEQHENVNYYHGVGWYDQTDNRYLQEGETFISGHEYRVNVAVYVQNYRYRLSQSVEATVNGTAADIWGQSSAKCIVGYTFGVCKKAPADITAVTIGGNLRPAAGQAPVFSLAYDNERMAIDTYAGTAFIDGVAWYNSETYAILDENDTFKAGNTYTMLVQLNAKGNYRFAVDKDGNSLVNATIEGVSAENISDQASQAPDQSRVLKVKAEFVCEETDSLGGGADYIGVSIPYPVAGRKMSYEPTLYGENCEYAYVTADGFYDGVKWVNRTRDFTYNKDSVFSEGSDYSVTILAKAKSVLQDENRLRYLLHEDGTVDPYILATVNGLPARVEPYGEESPAQVVQITFDFPACNSTARTIDDITFADIRTPVVGNKVDTVATVEFGYTENIPAAKKPVDITWIRIGEDGFADGVLTEEDVFEEGYRYAWTVDLSADALSDFMMENDRFVGNVSVRGAQATQVFALSSKQIMVGAQYIPLDSMLAPIKRIDIIGAVAPTVGQRPYYGGVLTEALMPFAEITEIVWYENGNVMAATDTFKKGNRYTVTYSVESFDAYTFEQTAVIRGSLNGNETIYNGYEGATGIVVAVSDDGQSAAVNWAYGELGDTAYTGVTDFVEIGELMRPAPEQSPDFDVTIDSPYTQFGGVTWYELDDNGYRMNALTPNDCFKKNTVYRAEICVLPSQGRSINIDSRGAVLNGEDATYYYLPGEAVIVYAEYDTANCITTLQIGDIQYPLPGKTPDTNIVFFGGQENLVTAVPYDANDTQIDWYYETNPGTAVAGFSRLDGKFKTDRRHQAYVQIQTLDDAWFATDNDGKLAVDAYADGVPMDFAYVTDTYLTDGAVNMLEAACTYELAKNADGVFVDGMWLRDGFYLDSNHWGVQTEDTVDKDAGYAYYNDGVLTLHDFAWETRTDYDAVASYHPLTVHIEGGSEMITAAVGINTGKALTLTGDKDASLTLMADQYGIFVNNTLTVNSGNWYISADTYDGVWLYSDFTMNGGHFEVYGETSGIYGDDWPRLTVSGGKLIATSPNDNAIAFCTENFADGMKVQVSTDICSGAAAWDGVTSLADYAYVSVEKPSGVLLGDVDLNGTVNTRDALRLYQHTSNRTLLTDPAALAAADVDGSGGVNMRDALALFQQVSGR